MDVVERCAECGFDGSMWTDAEAIAAISDLPDRWLNAVDGLSEPELLRRPIDDMWSIAEYADHVREVLFGMRFVLDIAVANSGIDLGPAPESVFSSQPASIDIAATLHRLGGEVRQLGARLTELDDDAWSSTAIFDGESHDAHWIARHAVHDATHHLIDVERLRAALGA